MFGRGCRRGESPAPVSIAQDDAEDRAAAGPVDDIDRPAVRDDDLPHEVEPDAVAIGPGREERQEDIASERFGNAAAIVFDRDRRATLANDRQGHARVGRGRAGLGGVAEQIDERLVEQVGVGIQHDAGIDIGSQRQIGPLAADQLAERGFVAGKQFADTSDAYAYEQQRLRMVERSRATDERLQASQLAQTRASATSMRASLKLARANLEALNLRAPVAGQLSGFSIQVGQSLSRGERVGQIDSPGRNKLNCGVDEFYLGRVALGQRASVTMNGRIYAARVAKIYPQVQNGQFQIDLHFTAGEPADLQRGQTLQARLTLGDAQPARLIPNGAFYNETGGNWVFVLAPDGRSAVKRQVRLGPRNADSIGVLDGLDRGERVITSPYTGFADKDRLDLSTS